MNQHVKIMIYLSTLIVYTHLHTGSTEKKEDVGEKIKTNLMSCIANGKVNCDKAVTAVGDLKDIPISASAKKAQTILGSITTPRTLSTQLPRIGGQELFTLTLTQPFSDNFLDKALANAPMEILFVSGAADTDAKKEMPDALSMVKIYRRMRDEKLWTEIATFSMNVAQSDMVSITVTMHSNGTTKFILDGEEQEIYLGKAV
jgi:hypothetical protein